MKHVHFVTELGIVDIDVDIGRAPRSAGAFLRYAIEGRYHGATFFRAVRADNDTGNPIIAVVQATVLNDGSPQTIVDQHETTAMTGIQHLDGVVSLARTEPGTASPAHFFICLGNQPALDFGGRRNPDGQGFAALRIPVMEGHRSG
jgi:peptidyl-prolyl cis-trans isomerase A (cyclophilin A)